MNRLSKKSVLLTGASSGIGQATAEALIRIGFQVLAGVRKKSDARKLRNSLGPMLVPVFLDLNSSAHIQRVTSRIRRDNEHSFFGLINNAGINTPGPTELISENHLRKVFEANFFGPMSLIRQLLPLLRKNKGRIVNIGSLSGHFSAPFLGPYSASKFALRGITDCLRRELLPLGVRVLIVEPGPVKSQIWAKSISVAKSIRRSSNPNVFKIYESDLLAMEKLALQHQNTAVDPTKVSLKVVEALTQLNPRPVTQEILFTRMATIFFDLAPPVLVDWLIRRAILKESAGTPSAARELIPDHSAALP